MNPIPIWIVISHQYTYTYIHVYILHTYTAHVHCIWVYMCTCADGTWHVMSHTCTLHMLLYIYTCLERRDIDIWYHIRLTGRASYPRPQGCTVLHVTPSDIHISCRCLSSSLSYILCLVYYHTLSYASYRIISFPPLPLHPLPFHMCVL